MISFIYDKQYTHTRTCVSALSILLCHATNATVPAKEYQTIVVPLSSEQRPRSASPLPSIEDAETYEWFRSVKKEYAEQAIIQSERDKNYLYAIASFMKAAKIFILTERFESAWRSLQEVDNMQPKLSIPLHPVTVREIRAIKIDLLRSLPS